MTEQEYQAALEEADKKLAANASELEGLKSQIKQLEENQKNQNSYITKLEEKTKQVPITSPNPIDMDITRYVQKNMKKDTINEAMAIIAQSVPNEVVECLKPELNKFLDNTMTIEKTKVSYVIDAFNLIRGRALSDVNHPINQIGKPTAAQPENKPQAGVQPQPQPQPQQTGNLSYAQRLAMSMGSPPPVGVPTMTPSDMNAAQTPPTEAQPITSTKDAMKNFKNRVMFGGANKFS